MKVKELIEILQRCNPDAHIRMCYEHIENKKVKCYYKEIDDIGYNQTIENNTVKVNEDMLLIWGD